MRPARKDFPASSISLAEGSVAISDETLFGTEADDTCARFLSRVFVIEEIRSVVVDRTSAKVTLFHGGSSTSVLGRLTNLLRASTGSPAPVPLPPMAGSSRFSIHRHGSTLTTWKVVIDEVGRLKLGHQALKGDPVAVDRIAHELLRVPGVRIVKASDRTGFLLVRYNPLLISSRALLGRAESTLFELQSAASNRPRNILARFGMANLTLTVATVGEFLLPALLPVSALLLVATNASTLRSAIRQLRDRKLGLPVLYIAIVLTTLATGQFLASALMTWLFRFWDKRFRVELASERNRLLERTGAGPLMARLCVPSGAEVLVPVARLKTGDVLMVTRGEVIPADGRIIAGEGVIDERLILGQDATAMKRTGQGVLAGSTVLAGSFQIEVARLGEATRAASIRRALSAATSPAPGQSTLTARSEMFASKAVGPTLATAGVGLLAGDLLTVGAILRPDYATGPGLAVPLETLHKVALCARSGIVARDPEALERLAEVELIVLQDHFCLRKPALDVTRIETRLPEAIVLRYAASAMRHLSDDRSVALLEACRDRRIHVLNLEAIEFGRGVVVAHDRHRIRVADVDALPDSRGRLAVEIDGTVVGLIEFGPSVRVEAASTIAQVRNESHVPFALVSPQEPAEISTLAASLGVEMFRGGFTTADTAEFLLACRNKGLKTAFLGDCRLHPEAARHAHVAISMVDGATFNLELDPAGLFIQQSRLAPLADLCRIARDHASRVTQAQNLILVPNLLCIAGAFLFGFTGMTAVMLSNLGTFGLYRIASGSLRGLDPPRDGIPKGQPRRAG